MQKQVSQISKLRAHEQKMLEESRRMYDEEEEEEEMTDGDTTGKSCFTQPCLLIRRHFTLFLTDTSDEEFVQEPVAGELSDVCSDLDEEEEQEVGPKAGMTSTRSSDAEASSDEGEGLDQPWLVRRKSISSRRLDSDDDEEAEVSEGAGGSVGVGVAEGACLLNTVESSMPPLRLDSVDDEGTPAPSSGRTSPADSVLGQSVPEEGEESGLVGKKRRRPSESEDMFDGDSSELSFQWGGQSLPPAQPCNASEWERVDGKTHQLHQPPPAPLPPVHQHDHTLSTQDILSREEESQWQATPTNPAQFLSQGLEDETQFLDEDG